MRIRWPTVPGRGGRTGEDHAYRRPEAEDPTGAVTEFEHLLIDMERVLGPHHTHSPPAANAGEWRLLLQPSARFCQLEVRECPALARPSRGRKSNRNERCAILIAVEQEPEPFDHSWAVNMQAPRFLTAALVPAMLKKQARSIVLISATAGRIALSTMSTYGAQKAALESLTWHSAAHQLLCTKIDIRQR
jgi:hypothetical protein